MTVILLSCSGSPALLPPLPAGTVSLLGVRHRATTSSPRAIAWYVTSDPSSLQALQMMFGIVCVAKAVREAVCRYECAVS
jgi:hypothetical protein